MPQAIVKDALARKLGSSGAAAKLPFTAEEVEGGLRATVIALLDGDATLEGDDRALGAALVCVDEPCDSNVTLPLHCRYIAVALPSSCVEALRESNAEHDEFE